MSTIERITAFRVAAGSTVYRPELDVLRFFAFLAVFMVHTAWYPPAYLVERGLPLWAARAAESVAYAGSYGVDLFFVLSAYLITELLLREKEECGTLDVKWFYVRRILRIWPLYFFFILIAALVPFCNPDHAFNLKLVASFLLLVGNWGLVIFGWPTSVAVPLWSVSVEEQFYLFWPPVVKRLSARGILHAALVMLVVAHSTRILVLFFDGNAQQLWGNTFAHLDSIAAGILLAILLRHQMPSLSLTARAAMIVAALMALALRARFTLMLPKNTLGWGETLFGWPVVVAACTALVVAFLGLNLHHPWLQYLGKISYGLYVYHLLCVKIADAILPNSVGLAHAVLRLLLSLALTIVFAALSYKFLESPFLRLKRKFTYVRSRPV